MDLRSHPEFNGLSPHIVDRFFEFHEANPKVFELFVFYASQLKEQGREHYGAKAIMERIRWHMEIETQEAEFKINNNYTACYTRLLSIRDSRFHDFFSKRASHSNTYTKSTFDSTGQGAFL